MSSVEEIAFQKYSKDVNFYIYYYESILIVPIGTSLNIATIAIYLRKKFQNCNFGFISAILVLFEIVSLIFTCVLYKYLASIDQDPSNNSDWVCFIFQYFGRIFQQIPAFIQVFISIYQYLQINLATSHSSLFKTKKSILITILIEIALISLVNIPNLNKILVYSNLTDWDNSTILKNKQTVSCIHTREISLLAGVETGLMRTVIPLSLLLIVNYMIARKLLASRKKFSTTQTTTSDTHKVRNFAFNLFFSNFLYLLFNLPVSVTYVTVMLYENQESFEKKRMELVHGITNAIAILFNALPFFISIALNKVFRAELKRFF